MSTVRVWGLYSLLKQIGSVLTADDLAEAFGGDRKTYLKDLKYLESLGLVSRTKQVINGRPITVSSLSDESPLNGLQILLSQLNTNINNITYSFISKKEYIRERMETPTMSDYEPSPMYLEPEERAEYSRKMREKRDREYREVRDAEVKKRIQDKDKRDPALWSTDDSAHYFAQRIEGMWHVRPWLTVRTRFKAAYGKSRKMHGTTGDIELKMMDRFFETLEHHKEIDDPEMIWKMFIKQFASLQVDVLRTTVTDEDRDEARALADKQWGDLDV